MNSASPDPVLTTLRYWAPGPFASSLGDDGDAHLAAGYDGLAECLDEGLLAHVPAADRYRLTARGERMMAIGLAALES